MAVLRLTDLPDAQEITPQGYSSTPESLTHRLGAMVGHLPYKEAILPLIGSIIGRRLPSPFLSSLALGAGGGALAGYSEAAKQSEEQGLHGALPDYSQSDITSSTVGGAILGAAAPGIAKELRPMLKGKPPETVQDIQFNKRYDVIGKQRGTAGAAKAQARLGFLHSLQREIADATRTSGEQVGGVVDSLHARFPDRHPVLAQNVSQALDVAHEHLMNNPSLKDAVITVGRNLKSLDLLQRVFPELQFESPSSETPAVIRQAHTQYQSGLMKAMQESGGLGVEPMTPEQMTLDDVQRVKQVFQRMIGDKFQQKGELLSRTDLDAMEIWGKIREAELQTHPELKKEFSRHRKVMQDFREVKPLVADSSAMEGALRTFFGGKAQERLSAQALLSPESFLKVERFASASELQQTRRALWYRVGRYLMILPVYRLLSRMLFPSSRSL